MTVCNTSVLSMHARVVHCRLNGFAVTTTRRSKTASGGNKPWKGLTLASQLYAAPDLGQREISGNNHTL